METVGAFEAKTHLAALLERVARGERIQITKRGVPVALLVPVEEDRKAEARDAVRRIRELRKGTRLGGLRVRDLIGEGRA